MDEEVFEEEIGSSGANTTATEVNDNLELPDEPFLEEEFFQQAENDEQENDGENEVPSNSSQEVLDTEPAQDNEGGNSNTEIDSKLDEILENQTSIQNDIQSLQASIPEPSTDYSETITDIATICSYQTILVVVLGCLVAISIGVQIASFAFKYLRDK